MIDFERTMTPRQLASVRARFLRAQMRPAHVPAPRFDGVRWSDDYGTVYIPDDSGLLPCGFESLFPEHEPVGSADGGRLYDAHNPAARSLLGAIAAVLRDLPFASIESEETTHEQ